MQANGLKIDTCRFLVRYSALLGLGKNWLALYQDNVTMSVMVLMACLPKSSWLPIKNKQDRDNDAVGEGYSFKACIELADFFFFFLVAGWYSEASL